MARSAETKLDFPELLGPRSIPMLAGKLTLKSRKHLKLWIVRVVMCISEADDSGKVRSTPHVRHAIVKLTGALLHSSRCCLEVSVFPTDRQNNLITASHTQYDRRSHPVLRVQTISSGLNDMPHLAHLSGSVAASMVVDRTGPGVGRCLQGSLEYLRGGDLPHVGGDRRMTDRGRRG